MAIDYLKKILTAKVYDVAAETELKFVLNLSVRTGNHVYLRRENDQPVFSFKLRSAYNKVASLMPAERKRGVIAASAGNHAWGVAFSAARMERKAVTCMPVAAPQLRIDGVRSCGGDWANVVLHGESYSDACNHAAKLQEKHGYTFVRPFDDPEVIAGQDTIAMEILRQHPHSIYAIFCSIGGGGLISGIAAYVEVVQPDVEIIGIQSMDSNVMARSVAAGKRVELKEVGLFADGAAVKLVGKETFHLTHKLIDEIIAMDTDAICAALKGVSQDTCSLLEPSGALALAGLRQYAEMHKLKDEPLVAVASGTNMDFDCLRFVIGRAEVGEAREAVFTVTIPGEHDDFKRFCELIGWSYNATEFGYRIASKDIAHIFVGVQIASHAKGDRIAESLRKHDFPTLDLSDDGLAKQHIRYMVGGRSPLAENKHLYRFRFPEWPDALMKFLSSMSLSWNISLFHYHNQGVDPSNILVSIQAPKDEKREFKTLLAALSYTYWDESEDPVYSLFLW